MRLLLWVLLLASFSINAQIINTESLRMRTDTTGWSGSVGLTSVLLKM